MVLRDEVESQSVAAQRGGTIPSGGWICETILIAA